MTARPRTAVGRSLGRLRRRAAGVALLMVITIIVILSLVLLEFSGSARTHLAAGTNIRDDVRATAMADTALVLTRACLDPAAWAALGSMQNALDLEDLCNMMLGIFISGRVDLPMGGLSIELQGIEGIGLDRGEIEDLKLIPEESFIGLAGLVCPNGGMNCPNQRLTVGMLRALLCDPRLSSLFENEQADGKKYSRGEIVANLIDWMDADDKRVQVDLNNTTVAEDFGEGEDSYYRELPERYRSKDAPLDSIEELRLIRGINDELFNYLKDRVSVHSAGKIDVNRASAEVLATLVKAASLDMAIQDAGACGEQSESRDLMENLLEAYAQLIVDARSHIKIIKMLGKPFKGPQGVRDFIAVAKDPIQRVLDNPITPDQVLNPVLYAERMAQRRGMTLAVYMQLKDRLAPFFDGLASSITTDSNLYRLRARGRVGNISRTIYAVIKKDGATVRTLYYREE